jgi:tetratricopeptide (TPR) repeat protein
VHAGLGAIALRRADQEKDTAAALKLVETALASFGQAGGVPEGAVGRGLSNLFIASRTNNPAKLIEARAAFEEAFKAAEAGQKMTRSGLLDLYAGYGACLAAIGESLELSYSLSKRATVFAPAWETPEANASLAVARWCWENPPALTELPAYRAKFARWLGFSQAKASQTRNYPTLQGPWSRMAAAIARLDLYQGDVESFHRTMDQIIHSKSEERFGRRLKAAMVSETFDPSNMSLDTRFIEQQVLAALRSVAADEGLTSPGDVRLRALAHNGEAVVREWLIARFRMHGDMDKHQEVRRSLEQAISIDPDCFPAWVNLALMHKRISALHGAGSPRQEALAAARAALEKAEAALQSRPADPTARERLARARALVGGN